MKTNRVARAVLLAGALLAAGHTLAQVTIMGGRGGLPDPRSVANYKQAMDGVRGERLGVMRENVSEQIEYRLNVLQEDLKLRPDQYDAWIAYTDKVKTLAADITREHSRAPGNTNAMQQIGGITSGLRNRLVALEGITASAKALYEGLSPEQKTVADARLATTIPDVYTGKPGVTLTR